MTDYEPFQVEGRTFRPTGPAPQEIQVHSEWRGQPTLICTMQDVDRIPRITWEPGWSDNPREWKGAIENAAVKARYEGLGLGKACEG